MSGPVPGIFLTTGPWRNIGRVSSTAGPTRIQPPPTDPHPGVLLSTGPKRTQLPSADPCLGVFLTTGPRKTHPPPSDPRPRDFAVTCPTQTQSILHGLKT
ncbi:hypothetical protein Y032_0052g2190 [Ancylostoma ceylanicum]|uniref:Uncharacterized protein n=1 Tax=Ancylostoma ceylanicum TaxID=53326 RepID=A0A016U7E1_9BILA|nr:hypothetical protein Y032_0052g2190 [Ancylostoma ceylanicum]